MQHLRLYRDADIVLIDYNDELLTNGLLPAGRLREPLSALGRASTIVITKVPVPVDEQKLALLLQTIKHHAPSAAVNLSRLVPSQLISIRQDACPLSRLLNAKIAIFSGLANPGNFKETLSGCGANIVKEFRYADHHWYSDHDLDVLKRAAAQVDLIVTSEKDLVKLQSYAPAPASSRDSDLAKKLYALQVKVEWIDGIPNLVHQLCQNSPTGSLSGVSRP
jgi:tetraacyldisaccharide 4'-kinase